MRDIIFEGDKIDILKEIEELKRKIAELEKEVKKENCVHRKLKYHDDYFAVSESGKVFESTWLKSETDVDRHSIGNCFHTKEEAEFAAEKLKVISELKDYEEKDTVWDENSRHYHILFDAEDGKIRVCVTEFWIPQGAIFFESEEGAKKAIEAVGEDRIRKYIFGR